MLKQLICLLVLVIFFSACTTTTPLTDADVRVVEMSIGETQLGSPCFLGVIENTGGKVARNVEVTVACYDSVGKQVDLATTYYGDQLAVLTPGDSVNFEAPFYVATPQVVASYDTEVTWE